MARKRLSEVRYVEVVRVAIVRSSDWSVIRRSFTRHGQADKVKHDIDRNTAQLSLYHSRAAAHSSN